MEFKVTTKGPSFDKLLKATARDLTAAHKTAGRRVARTGRAAVKKDAPTRLGRKLGAKVTTTASTSGCVVTFDPSPAGGWAMQESGTKPHTITPRSRKALHWANQYAEVVHHPGTTGRQAWTRAVERIAKAVDRDVVDVYDDALGG